MMPDTGAVYGEVNLLFFRLGGEEVVDLLNGFGEAALYLGNMSLAGLEVSICSK